MKNLFLSIVIIFSSLSASEFTVASYNCGCLSDNYDYIRAVCMGKLMQERYNAEPEKMARAQKVQKVALKNLFQNEANPVTIEDLTAPCPEWSQKVDETVTNFKVRPIVIKDEEVARSLFEHLQDLCPEEGDFQEQVTKARAIMAERIFRDHLKYDIICLQEANPITPEMLPLKYDILFSKDRLSVAIAWNQERFELLATDTPKRALLVELRDKTSDETIAITTTHLTGCNPFVVVDGDSKTGDQELLGALSALEKSTADIKVIAMDSNVTATHPRLKFLKDYEYKLDCETFLEQTCTNPHQVLNTRIDWLACKSDAKNQIANIPVQGIGLNSLRTNISDHKPIAAKIIF